jgi:ribosomal protein S18 acetylase RimI-like enzyme
MIRVATVDDARAIAEVHVASWRAGYRGLVADEVLDGLSVDQRAELWNGILADGETVVLIARGDPVAGFIAFKPDTGAIGALYVDPSRFRRGVGTALLTAAHERMQDTPEVVLWVLEGNDAARAFYERHGYEADDAKTLDERTRAEQRRMVRKTPE